ncbi:glycosyltransferase [Leucobacter sp. M11]|uniref:glycosyltransferase n=1 Tax=Leucobacter sp. M11 TaxID=2993565 RepID=UPI002D7F7235|nr:hypothetical protein [Leucobacter sp. M11]MEB4615421.1 hypothetical protein [Leucobacter sp. M11]
MNYAGQGYAWARAVEQNLDEVGAVSMAYTGIGEFGFPVDQSVPATGYVLSKTWQREQAEAVASGFTHVMAEAERHLFGRVYDQSVEDQLRALEAAGVRVCMLAHGSDIRLPSRHAAAEPLSPFRDGEWQMTEQLEREARKNRALLEELGYPVFVSTLGLLPDVPDGAEWLPVVVDPSRWAPGAEILQRNVPVILHAPSRGLVKGSALIDPVLQRMHDDGEIVYRRVSGIPAHEMPAAIREADLVLDQFRIGDYGVAACEAMLAERLVVSHVTEDVRNQVLTRTGRALPILQATPATLQAVIRQALSEPEQSRALAREGRNFALDFHDGRRSAAVLAKFLITNEQGTS